jgi:hypothetical protein
LSDWHAYLIVICFVVLLFRIERLGIQIEAVCADVKAELSTPERADEILREWKEGRREAKKTLRMQLMIWVPIVLALIAWHAMR